MIVLRRRDKRTAVLPLSEDDVMEFQKCHLAGLLLKAATRQATHM